MKCDSEPLVTVLGEEAQSGTYILRILLQTSLTIRFGRFRDGQAVTLEAGEYLYVGSAMGQKGSSSLGRRLVRHATRSDDGPPHEIRAVMLNEFARLGPGNGDLCPQRGKRLFWHVDYLLDRPEVSLTHVLALRSRARLEQAMAELVAAQPFTSTPVRGLGASDTAGGTHLFAVAPVAKWWLGLMEAVRGRRA